MTSRNIISLLGWPLACKRNFIKRFVPAARPAHEMVYCWPMHAQHFDSCMRIEYKCDHACALCKALPCKCRDRAHCSCMGSPELCIGVIEIFTVTDLNNRLTGVIDSDAPFAAVVLFTAVNLLFLILPRCSNRTAFQIAATDPAMQVAGCRLPLRFTGRWHSKTWNSSYVHDKYHFFPTVQHLCPCPFERKWRLWVARARNNESRVPETALEIWAPTIQGRQILLLVSKLSYICTMFTG